MEQQQPELASPSPPPRPPRADPLLFALSSPTLRLDLATTYLRAPSSPPPPPLDSRPSASTTTTPAHPLAVLLFLLDSLAFLRAVHAHGLLAPSSSSSSSSSTTTAPLEGTQTSSDPSSTTQEEGQPVPSGQLSSTHYGPGERAGSHDSRDFDDEEEWEEWIAYISEVYLYPATGDEPTAEATPAHAPWRSPLPVASTISSLVALCAETIYTRNAHQLVVDCATSAISYLSHHPLSPSSNLEPAPLLEALLLSHRSSTPPSPSLAAVPDSSTLSSTASTLSSRRRAEDAGSPPPTLAFRCLLSDVLNHHFPNHFEQSAGPDGTSLYSESPEDHLAICRFYRVVYQRRDSVGEHEAEDEAELDRETGLRAASLSITRRDDKMRWIFGANYQQPSPGPSPSSSPPEKSAYLSRQSPRNSIDAASLNHVEVLDSDVFSAGTKPRRPRPVSMGSIASTRHSHSTVTETHHRRTDSSTSSNAPLIETHGSPTSATPPQALFHRRGVSVGTAPSLPPLLHVPTLQPFKVRTPFTDLQDLGGPHSPTSLAANSRRASTGSPRFAAPLLTTNSLTPAERRELVRRSKKLNQMLGVPLEEEAAQRVLVDAAQSTIAAAAQPLAPYSSSPPAQDDSPLPSISPNNPYFTPQDAPKPSPPRHPFSRSLSYPPPSPSATSFDDTTQPPTSPSLSSTGMMRSASSPASRRDHASATSYVAHAHAGSIPNASAFSALGGTPEAQRDERRRKVAKLQRLLGENVPSHLALNETPGKASSGSSSLTKPSGRLGGMLKGAGSKLGFVKKEDKDGGVTKRQETVVEVDPGLASGTIKNPQPPLNDLHKARKLENLFGDLPPRALYSGPTPSHHHQRSKSDFPALGRSPSNATSTRSLDSYRNSIASLQYLVEQDPETLDAIARSYTGERDKPVIKTEAPSGLSPIAGSPELDDEREPAPRSSAMLRRTSSQGSNHQRTVRSAQKLASFFGTTRGEVWGLLLDDLEAAIEEEEGIDAEEKREVLDGVSRLRESTTSTSVGRGDGGSVAVPA